MRSVYIGLSKLESSWRYSWKLASIKIDCHLSHWDHCHYNLQCEKIVSLSHRKWCWSSQTLSRQFWHNLADGGMNRSLGFAKNTPFPCDLWQLCFSTVPPLLSRPQIARFPLYVAYQSYSHFFSSYCDNMHVWVVYHVFWPTAHLCLPNSKLWRKLLYIIAICISIASVSPTKCHL